MVDLHGTDEKFEGVSLICSSLISIDAVVFKHLLVNIEILFLCVIGSGTQ
jgi:hypothetical protein